MHNLLVSLIDGMYSKTWTVEQWWSRSIVPRKPDDGGVGNNGHDVTDCNQFHMDQRDSVIINKYKHMEVERRRTKIDFNYVQP